MAPFLFALLLLAQDAPAAEATSDGPVATQTARKQDVAPLPIQGGPVSAPTDDFGYVNWCYGAVSGYVDLYDRAMPEVIRIERAWPTPGTEENINEIYPAQKADSLANIELFKRAIAAAEKASPTPIHEQGLAAAKRGRAIWTGATSVPKAQLAQFWMSWSPPSKCEATAKELEKRSNLFGQALTSNDAVVASPLAARPKPVEAPVETAVAAEPAPAPEAAPEAETTQAAAVDSAGANEVVAEAGDVTPTADAGDGAEVLQTAEAPVEDAVGGSAIEDLLPGGDESAADAVEAAAEDAAPVAAGEPVAEAPKPAAKPARKPGLKDTLKGLRGPE
ncbi:MAG: hypothetical protein KA105_08500 [Caulobacter sp.]|nr:hypothetical protein [Caulobacter sp.]